MMYDGDFRQDFQFVSCNACQFIYLNPRIAEQEIYQFYPNYYLSYRGAEAWGKYANMAQWGRKIELNKRIKLTKKYANSKHNRILDVGCGKPEYLYNLNHNLGWETVGIDFDTSAWNDERYKNIRLTRADTNSFDYAQLGQFDMITMWHYLEHDYKPAHTLKALLDVSKPSSKLIIEVPDYDSLSRKLQGMHWEGFHTPRHVSVFNHQSLQAMLEKNGWKVIRRLSYGSLDPYVLWWMGQREKKGLKWDKSLENEFPTFMMGKILSFPLTALEGFFRLGVQTLIATPA
jgi:SAM-dependent methyltransferase